MTTSQAAKEIADDYVSSLSELTLNSKPLINMLTMLADDNVEHAAAIVKAVENHLQKVRSDIKLPVLYLIDSIVKNVSGAYLKLFTENIVNTFCGVFEKVDEKTRESMWKLRQTWNDVFPAKKLFSLDVRVQSIDPAWPIAPLKTSVPSGSIHFNPRFFPPSVTPPATLPVVTPAVVRPPTTVPVVRNPSMHDQMLQGQQKLIDLQRQKLELEMLQAQVNLAQQQKKLNDQVAAVEAGVVAPIAPILAVESTPVKPVTPIVLSQASKSVAKQFPAAAASLLKNAGTSNGPRIAPASSLLVASARSLSRDPRLKSTTEIASSSSLLSSTSSSLNASNNDNPNATNNNNVNNKTLNSDNLSKDAVVMHRTNQKKDPRSSSSSSSSNSNNSGNLNSNSTKSSTSSRTSPQSTTSQSSKSRKKTNSDSSKARKKTINKSRKRSPSPSYRIPRRNTETKSNSLSLMSATGLTEEEQSGSLIVSPPHPPTFKEIRPNARQRNYIRRNKESGTISPDNSSQGTIINATTVDTLIESASKDEDLRAALIPASAATVLEKKEDLDLRVLPPTSKRKSSEHLESSSKKSKTEKFDALFGNEDVDLRTLTNPKAGRPPTPPPPVISGEDNKTSWAKIKTPLKSDREKSTSGDEKRDRDRNKERVSRLRPYSKPTDDVKERRRPFINNDDDSRPGRRNRDMDKPERMNTDRNIEIIMKQAQEQLNDGSITKPEYHKMIQEIWLMNEDQKLRAAQRKEKEAGTTVWEKGIDLGDMGGHRGKDHPHPRNGPRWQSQWQHPPGAWGTPYGPGFGGHVNSDFRPMGPWPNPRQFGPMRPEFNQFHGFNSGMGPGPRMGPGLLGPMGPNGPMMPGMMPNGPIGPLGLPNTALPPLNGPPSLMMNGPHQQHIMGRIPSPVRNISPNSAPKYDLDETQSFIDKDNKEAGTLSRELPLPDSKLIDEIKKDTMKSINIDGVLREIRYYGQTGVVFMNWDEPREIGFQDGIRRILVDEKDTIVCAFNESYKEFVYEGDIHKIRLGAPTRELFVDDKWYECYFGGPPIKVDLGNKKVSVKLEGPPPQVKIGNVKRTDLVVAKINLIINARNMVPVFLDAKPQIFEIDGQQQTLEFTDSLETVLLNGRPFKVEFGGLPKPIMVRGKKHFIRFSVLPRGVRAGCVKIANMKGDSPTEPILDTPVMDDVKSTSSQDAMSIATTNPPGIEADSTSQDASEGTSTSKASQLDILSSALSSAMAPSSGLSYQAEPTEKSASPAPLLPLNLSELFQRLVETGIVPKVEGSTDTKPPVEEVKKEPELPEISFDKPEVNIKVRNLTLASKIFSGMQCSSCGERFPPESATKYSYHLDWHFRQNRRERDPARKAPNRSLYYGLSDWTQFEEMEDVEDRAQSWFEIEKQSAEAEGANVDDIPQESVQPSVPTGSDEDSVCQVCHEAFEQFYNEEKEEWHLRPAVAFESRNYHPLCLQDHKRSLEQSALDESMTEDEKKDELDESEEKMLTDSEMTKCEMESTDQKDEPVESTAVVSEQTEATEAAETPMEEESKEETVESADKTIVTNDGAEEMEKVETDESKDVNEEVKGDESKENSLLDSITIKKEPEESTEMEWSTVTPVEIKTEPIEAEPEPEECLVPETAPLVDTTMTAVTSSIDGNVELESAPTTIPTAPSRIKINITKSIVMKEPEEPKEKVPTIETPTVEEEKSGPLVPASIKPSLQGRKLSNLPPIEKGHELSGLCSIM